MNILKIVVALICAYGLFVSISYLLMRLIFPKIEVTEEEEDKKVALRAERKLSTTTRLRKQKHLAY